jgi:hypothetical protein
MSNFEELMEQTETKIPSRLDIENKTRDFLRLLEQRELGLMTWQEARARMARELYEMLGRVLGKS